MLNLKKGMLAPIASLVLTQFCFAQSILEESTLDSSQLDSAQFANYQFITHDEEFVNYRLIHVQDLESIQDSGRVIIDLPNFQCAQLTFLGKNVEYLDRGSYTWYGEIVNESDDLCNEGVLFLLAHEGERFGYLKIDTTEYLFLDIGGGVQVLAQVDTAYSVCGVLRKEGEGGFSSMAEITENCNGCDVKLFAHFTTAARHKKGTRGMHQRIRLAIAQVNQGLRNSAVQSKIRVVLAGLEVLENFTETRRDVEGDLIRYGNRTDVQVNRINYEADISVLFCIAKDPYVGGSAHQGGLGGTKPYGIVDTDRAISNKYVFTHEVGHLLNADHLYPDPDRPGYNKGHEFYDGWLFNNTRYVTVMNSRDGQKRELLNFSNPSIYYKRKATGIIDERHNARAIDEYGCTVANFIPNPVVPVFALISGYNTACGCKSADYWVSAYCGTGSYSYEWQISYDGIDFLTVGSNSNMYSLKLPCSQQIYNLHVRVIVTDGSGGTATAQKTVMVVPTWSVRTCDAGVITESKPNHLIGQHDKMRVPASLMIMSVSPQPADNYVDLKLNSSSVANLRIEVIDINGRIVKTEPQRAVNEGLNSFKIDVSGLSPGLYFIISKTTDAVLTQKIIIN